MTWKYTPKPLRYPDRLRRMRRLRRSGLGPRPASRTIRNTINNFITRKLRRHRRTGTTPAQAAGMTNRTSLSEDQGTSRSRKTKPGNPRHRLNHVASRRKRYIRSTVQQLHNLRKLNANVKSTPPAGRHPPTGRLYQQGLTPPKETKVDQEGLRSWTQTEHPWLPALKGQKVADKQDKPRNGSMSGSRRPRGQKARASQWSFDNPDQPHHRYKLRHAWRPDHERQNRRSRLKDDQPASSTVRKEGWLTVLSKQREPPCTERSSQESSSKQTGSGLRPVSKHGQLRTDKVPTASSTGNDPTTNGQHGTAKASCPSRTSGNPHGIPANRCRATTAYAKTTGRSENPRQRRPLLGRSPQGQQPPRPSSKPSDMATGRCSKPKQVRHSKVHRSPKGKYKSYRTPTAKREARAHHHPWTQAPPEARQGITSGDLVS